MKSFPARARILHSAEATELRTKNEQLNLLNYSLRSSGLEVVLSCYETLNQLLVIPIQEVNNHKYIGNDKTINTNLSTKKSLHQLIIPFISIYCLME